MAAAPKASHQTAKQRAASLANLRKARATARGLPRTAKQQAASRRNLVKARAAQKARHGGKKPVAAKKAKAPQVVDYAPDLGIHVLPVCGPVALAAHLRFWAGIQVPVADMLRLHDQAGDCTLADLLELVTVEGLAGIRLESFRRCDPDLAVPGWLYGIGHPAGYHAVLALPGGMASWGQVLPLAGTPAEAWHLTWVV